VILFPRGYLVALSSSISHSTEGNLNQVTHALARHRSRGERISGAADSSLVIMGAIVFFVLFAAISLWLILRSGSKQISGSPSPSAGFPAAASSGIAGSPSPAYAGKQIAPGFPSSPSATAPSAPASGAPAPGASIATTTTPAASSFASSSPAQTSPVLDAATAKGIVEKWLDYKKVLFSSSYDTSKMGSYIYSPGPVYDDITKKGGSLDWLRSSKSYYSYNDAKVLNIVNFSQSGENATLVARILEDSQLHIPSGIDKSRSGQKEQDWVYELKLRQGQWLIYNSKQMP